jgi:hypothetical protein
VGRGSAKSSLRFHVKAGNRVPDPLSQFSGKSAESNRNALMETLQLRFRMRQRR